MDAFLEGLDPDPHAQFDAWYADAAAGGVANPEEVALATATPDGLPSVRMVLLKGHGPDGFAFYTNRESRKGLELAVNPRAALAFHWHLPQERQVRVEGPVETIGVERSAAYFASRHRGSRLAAWASPQSRQVDGRAELDRRLAAATERFAGTDIPLPPFWGGYLVVPHTIELWQAREHRFHDRVRYERSGKGWTRFRLGP
jgi:pyridoxamine 5'-phosphate oxidase